VLQYFSLFPISSSSPLQPQSQPATDEPAAVDLANLALIVDELEGTTSRSSAPHDWVDLVVACLFRLIRVSFSDNPHSRRLLSRLCGVELWHPGRAHDAEEEEISHHISPPPPLLPHTHMAYTSCFFVPSGFIYRVPSHFSCSFSSFPADRRAAEWPRVESGRLSHVSPPAVSSVRFHTGLLVKFPISARLVPVDTALSKSAHVVNLIATSIC